MIPARITGDELAEQTMQALGFVVICSFSHWEVGSIVYENADGESHRAAKTPLRIVAPATEAEVAAAFKFQDQFFGRQLRRSPFPYYYRVEAAD